MNKPYQPNLSTNAHFFLRNKLLRGIAVLGLALLISACGGQQNTPSDTNSVPGAVTPQAEPMATPDATTEVPGAVTPEIEATTAP